MGLYSPYTGKQFPQREGPHIFASGGESPTPEGDKPRNGSHMCQKNRREATDEIIRRGGGKGGECYKKTPTASASRIE